MGCGAPWGYPMPTSPAYLVTANLGLVGHVARNLILTLPPEKAYAGTARTLPGGARLRPSRNSAVRTLCGGWRFRTGSVVGWVW
jgi:hypothetical protein